MSQATEEANLLKKRAIMLLIILPIIIAALVFGGYYLGAYLSERWGLKDSFAVPLLFTTAGFIASLVIAVLTAESLLGVKRRAKQNAMHTWAV